MMRSESTDSTRLPDRQRDAEHADDTGREARIEQILTEAGRAPAGNHPVNSIAALGRRLGHMQTYYDALERVVLDNSEFKKGGDKERHDGAEQLIARINRQSDDLQEAIGYGRAEVLADVLTQAIIGFAAAEDLAVNASLKTHFQADAERIRRIFQSIAAFAATHGGHDPNHYGAASLMYSCSDSLAPNFLLPEIGAFFESFASVAGPVTPAPRACGSIERQLAALVAEAEQWWSVYDTAGDREAEAQETGLRGSAKERMAHLASGHAVRISRDLLARAVNLPATTVPELALQAKLVAAELSLSRGPDGLSDGEAACDLLLDRLMGLAGVERIPRPDVTIAEARDWLENPDAHASILGYAAREARS